MTAEEKNAIRAAALHAGRMCGMNFGPAVEAELVRCELDGRPFGARREAEPGTEAPKILPKRSGEDSAEGAK